MSGLTVEEVWDSIPVDVRKAIYVVMSAGNKQAKDMKAKEKMKVFKSKVLLKDALKSQLNKDQKDTIYYLFYLYSIKRISISAEGDAVDVMKGEN